MKKKLQIFLEAGLAAFLVLVLTFFNLISPLDYIAKDSLYQVPRGIDNQIKIIGIDEKTLTELGPIQTWSREIYANLIDKLNENPDAKPMLIGFDIQFSGEVDEGDALFAEKAKESGNVVCVDHLLYGRMPEIKNGVLYYPVEGVEEPYAALKENVKLGFCDVALDSDGTVRRMIPVETYDGRDYETFSRVLYGEYCRIQGIEEHEIPVDKSGRSIINYSGRPGDYECLSLVDVLDGKIDTRAFQDSIVLVGAYAHGMQDDFDVPTSGSKEMYGVEVHANILQSYIQNRFAINGNAIIFGIITALVAFALHIIFRKLKIWQSLLILIASIVLEVVICVTLNNNGYSYSIIYLPLVSALSFIYCIVMGYLMEKARKKKVLDAFRKYVAPQIVEELSKTGEFEINVGGENRDIAALFVDIRGFTTMSEALEPEEVVEILNEYLTLTTNAIFKNDGTLDKFVGDCTMAVFNSPFDLEDYEYKAVCAALDIVNDGKELQKKLMEKHGRTIGYGVGVNVGPAVVGNIGCDFRMDFTAIGDTVNTAARLEANAKAGQVLISDELYERLKDRIEVNGIGEIPLKGKSKGVYVYEVTGLK
ncbi:MAG: adenylate/guanylate cyclase domain-containing protein [Eubacterium sp.]|nr:adenylate/guanylate cyclase domain-containing protein [Eubacterium sp.]